VYLYGASFPHCTLLFVVQQAVFLFDKRFSVSKSKWYDHSASKLNADWTLFQSSLHRLLCSCSKNFHPAEYLIPIYLRRNQLLIMAFDANNSGLGQVRVCSAEGRPLQALPPQETAGRTHPGKTATGWEIGNTRLGDSETSSRSSPVSSCNYDRRTKDTLKVNRSSTSHQSNTERHGSRSLPLDELRNLASLFFCFSFIRMSNVNI
jgi:hypothetical protein